jgi:hypothetical protein
MTAGSVAAMDLFNFPKRWKYFGEPPAAVSLEQDIYHVLRDSLQDKLASSATRHAKAMIPFALKPANMKGGRV